MKTRKVLVMATAVLDLETGDQLETKPVSGVITKANGKKVKVMFPTYAVGKKGLAASLKAGHQYLDRLVAAAKTVK